MEFYLGKEGGDEKGGEGLAALAGSPRGFGQRFDLGIGLMGTSKQTRLFGVKGLVWKVWGS